MLGPFTFTQLASRAHAHLILHRSMARRALTHTRCLSSGSERKTPCNRGCCRLAIDLCTKTGPCQTPIFHVAPPLVGIVEPRDAPLTRLLFVDNTGIRLAEQVRFLHGRA